MRRGACSVFALAMLFAQPGFGHAAEAPPAAPGSAAVPASEQSVTRHRFAIDSLRFDYTATAGTLVIRDDADKPIASISYTAYVRNAAPDRPKRPIVFAFNGGPGASSAWLHMGLLGPKRVAAVDADFTPPAPYGIVDNPDTVLEFADIVLVDPVGTGLSRAVGEKKDKDFWGVDPDIDSVGRFVAQYVNDNGRWNSPKYLLGESYGTTRAAGVVHWLQSRRTMAFNGVMLLSVALDIEAVYTTVPGNDRPYALYIPAYAVVAQKYGLVAGTDRPRDALVAEAKAFAYGPYLAALMQGDSLPDAERDSVAAKLHEYTGLTVEYLKAANLRVSEAMFDHELLKAKRLTVSRLDPRFTGATLDPLAREAEYDPQSGAVGPAYAAAFNTWWREGLKFGAGTDYRLKNGEIRATWMWEHRIGELRQPIVNTGVDLARAMVANPDLRVLVMNGWYDLATPFPATEYMIDHLGLPPGFRSHIESKYYESGHMLYVNQAVREQMTRDLRAFIHATSGLSR